MTTPGGNRDRELRRSIANSREQGEVDLVSLEPGTQRPRFAIEVKWSDRPAENPKILQQLAMFAERHKLDRAPLTTTYSRTGAVKVDGVEIELSPTALGLIKA